MRKFQYWRAIRFGVVAFSFISQFFAPPVRAADVHLTWTELGVIFVIIPVLFLADLGVLLLFRGARKFDWLPPSWDENPLNFSHPEQFFHLGAFVMLASGSVAFARGIIQSSTVNPIDVAPIAAGGGMWLALCLLTAVYRRQQRNGVQG